MLAYDTVFGFSGINKQVSPFLVDTGEVSDSQNFVTEKIGVLKKSFDYSILGESVGAGISIYVGTDFFRNDGTHEHFIATNSSTEAEIYKYSSGWVSQEQNLTKNYRVRFSYSPTIDTLFAVNYIDATRSYDGTTWSTATNVTDAPKAYYTISFGDRIYLLNCKVGETSYPTRAYRSDAIESSATWDSNEYIVFEDTITGVGINGQNMFVGCQGSTYIFTLADEKIKVSNIGCLSNESIVTYGQYTFYASTDGYYAFDGSNTFKVSSQIQDFWDNISSTSNVRAVGKGNHIYVYLGNVTDPEDSSTTLTNVIFDYNVLQNNWNRGRLGSSCTNLHTFTESSKKIYMGDTAGNVFELLDNSGQQNGSDYSSFIETHWSYGSGAGILDDYREIIGFGKNLSSLKVSCKTQETSDWKDLGELTGDTCVVNFRPIRAYKIKFRLAEFSGKNLFEFYRLDIGYNESYKKDAD